MGSKPTFLQIEQTVERMELRLYTFGTPEVKALMRHYTALIDRFKADLEDARDVVLARSAALMLVNAVAEEQQQGR